MLTADRQGFNDRAVKCFLDQTYIGAHLFIYDTGEQPYTRAFNDRRYQNITTAYNSASRGKRIGALRNEAIDMIKADIIVTWDSDDWSAPDRLTQQVASLRDQMATGYHNLLFLDTRAVASRRHCDAWDYDHRRWGGKIAQTHVVGSSLAYWREAWQRHPFVENQPYGEDNEFCRAVKVQAVNGIGTVGVDAPPLIAEVHGQNTSWSYGVFDRHSPVDNPEWRRAPEWDDYCRARLYP